MLITFMDKRMNLVRNHMQWYDISLIKIGSMIFALLVAKYFSWLLTPEWYWYVLLLLLIYVRFIYLSYLSKKN